MSLAGKINECQILPVHFRKTESHLLLLLLLMLHNEKPVNHNDGDDGDNAYRFPRVFGDEFGDEFGDSLNFVSKLVTHLVMISVNHRIW